MTPLTPLPLTLLRPGLPSSKTAGAAPEAQARSGAEPQAAPEAGTATTDDLDETKRKFREALDRKKQAHANDTAAAGERAAGKARGRAAPPRAAASSAARAADPASSRPGARAAWPARAAWAARAGWAGEQSAHGTILRWEIQRQAGWLSR